MLEHLLERVMDKTVVAPAFTLSRHPKMEAWWIEFLDRWERFIDPGGWWARVTDQDDQ